MRILILDVLLNQTNEKKIAPDVLPRLYKEYKNLVERENQGLNSVKEYLKSKNGKEMKGAEHIYKFRLTYGDRILYSYGKHFDALRDEESDSLVLLGYAKHEEQGFFAQHTEFFQKTGMVPARQIVEDIETVTSVDEIDMLSAEDIEIIASFWDSDYISKHSFSVISDEKFAELAPEEWDKYLSDEQNSVIESFLKNPVPTLILGGAGTGKTLIGTHLINAFNSENPEKRSAYFTQSFELRQKVEHDYKAISDGDVSCFNINDYFRKITGIELRDFVETPQFFIDFFNKTPYVIDRCRKNGIDPMDVWTEIRGVIKGSMSPAWERTSYQSQDDYNGSIEPLVAQGFFTRLPENKKLFVLSDSVPVLRQKAADTPDLSAADRQNLEKAFSYFSSFDSAKSALTRTEYLKLPDENSTIDYELRKVIYSVYEQYAAFLKLNSLYDENDVARLAYDRIGEFDYIDFIFVDEVQDYTELQLYVINHLCAGKQIVFAGDAHQNVNPTLFREDRLKQLYNDENNVMQLKTVYLSKNFRCSSEIVDAANSLAAIRRKTIGSGKQEGEQPGSSERHSNPAVRLKYSRENFNGMITDLVKFPRTAILVPNNEIKEQLRETSGSKSVFTVSEIKGMEYNYVLCYNLFGYFSEIWKRMLTEKVSHKTKYRFYFNLIYVAITRAQNNLCFIDEDIAGTSVDRVIPLNSVDSYNRKELYISGLTNDVSEWYKDAQQLEQNGKYEEAIESYQKSGELATKRDIFRCKAELYRTNRDFQNAVRYAVLAGNQQRAKELSAELSPDSDLCRLVDILNRPDLAGRTEPEMQKLSSVIENEFEQFENEEKEAVLSMTTEAVRKEAQKRTLELSTFLSTITEAV